MDLDAAILHAAARLRTPARDRGVAAFSALVRSAMTATIGGRFTSVTVHVKPVFALSVPSLAVTVTL